MAKGKKGKKGRRNDDWSDEEEEETKPTQSKAQEQEQLSRKQKRTQKQNQKQTKHQADDNDSDDDDVMALIKGAGKQDYDDDDEDDDYAIPQSNKQGGRKGRPPARQQVKLMEEEEEDEEEQIQQQAQKGKRGSKRGSTVAMAATTVDDEEDEEEIPQPVQKGKHGNKHRSSGASSAVDEEEDEEEIENEEDDEEEVEQIAFTIIDDDDSKEKKKKKKKDKDKKKEKKAKKEKKKKKDKKEGKVSSSEEDEDEDHLSKEEIQEEPTVPIDDKKEDVDPVTDKMQDLHVSDKHEDMPKEPEQNNPEPSEPHKPNAPARPKSKFELQMEEAMRKKKEAEAQAEVQHDEEAKKLAEKERLAAEAEEKAEREAEEIRKRMEEEERKAAQADIEEFYGHGDEAWTDKSAAHREAELLEGDDPHRIATHGADGKKLSNKERKRLIKEREVALREAEYEKVAAQASREGAQFACSQTAVNENDPQWENALDIKIPNFSISAAGKILFKDAELVIGAGRRYGLVGPNGKGKSTLLKMIASRDLKIPPRIDFLYVEQEVVADETPAVEAVLKADKKRWDLLEEEVELMKTIDDGDEDMTKLERLQLVTEELAAMGADAAEAKARRILFGLGFDMEMQVKPTKMFSGGWRMRISLARALFVEPTLLMLDEPTNHLDLNAVIWLDDYLQRWKKTLLVVSHDQDFLNSVTQEILHIEDLKLVSYKGNYDSFKKAEQVKFQQQVKAWEKQEKRLRELKRSGQSRTKAQETVKQSQKREPAARNKKQQNDAIASGTEAAQSQELIKRPKEYTVKFEFSEVADIGRPVMQVEQVHFRYSARHPVIFDCVDFGIDMESRICVVGPNGAGKSTLLKLMTGELEPTRGEVRRNPRLRMGVYNQHFVDKLPMNKTPVEFLRDRFQEEDYQSIRNRLGKYGLEGHAHEVVMRDLSGGQKARVTFVELSLQNPHILLLDEPTNNLDIESIDALIDAINEFNGGIVVVTHDQRLIENCECTLWVVEKQKVTPWEKGFDDYKETLLREMEEHIEQQNRERQKKLEEAARAKAEKLARLASKIKS